ncbi:MAG: hypothetical protein AAF213_11395, partial [Pseudomonadota bacterium]
MAAKPSVKAERVKESDAARLTQSQLDALIAGHQEFLSDRLWFSSDVMSVVPASQYIAIIATSIR